MSNTLNPIQAHALLPDQIAEFQSMVKRSAKEIGKNVYPNAQNTPMGCFVHLDGSNPYW